MAKKETKATTTTSTVDETLPQPKAVQATYYLYNLPWIPHYKLRGVFVSPGNKQITESELVMRGATRIMQPLWTRETV